MRVDRWLPQQQKEASGQNDGVTGVPPPASGETWPKTRTTTYGSFTGASVVKVRSVSDGMRTR